MALALAQQIRHAWNIDEGRSAWLRPQRAHRDEEMRSRRRAPRLINPNFGGSLGAERSRRLEDNSLRVVFEEHQHVRKNLTELGAEFFEFEFVNMKRIGSSLFARLGIVQLVRRGNNELT